MKTASATFRNGIGTLSIVVVLFATTVGRAENVIGLYKTRGMIALVKSEKEVYLGWRSYAGESATHTFDIYRSTDGGARVKLNDEPIRNSTGFVDQTVPLTKSNRWELAVVRGGNSIEWVDSVSLTANSAPRSYVSIKLQGDYPFSKVGIADLDGDGKLDFVIKQPQQTSDPGVWQLSTNTFKVEAYRHDGRLLWRNDLGWNIEQGVWWSPMIVADLDGDGKAEVALKTAPMEPAYRNAAGRILDGPE